MVFDPFLQQKLMASYDKLATAKPAPVEYSIDQLKTLAGVKSSATENELPSQIDGTSKAEFMKKHNIRPGTDEWFKLWFAKPHLTGENPKGR